MQFIRKIILSLLIIVFCSALAFASEDSPSPEQAPLEVDWPKLELMTSAGEVRAAAKTLDDVYNILNTGLMSGSTPKLDNIYSNIASNLEFWAGSTRYSIADLQGMTWQIANSINNQLTSTNSILGNIYNNIGTTNAKLEYVFSAIEDTINLKWYTSSLTYLGTSLTRSTNYFSSPQQNIEFYSAFSGFTAFNQNDPCIIRLFVPIKLTSNYVTSSNFSLDIHKYSSNSFSSLSPVPDFFTENTLNGTYFYIFGFRPTFDTLFFHVYASGQSLRFDTTYPPQIVYIPFDTMDYQVIKTAFYQAKAASNQSELTQAAQDLANYFVSPAKQAAENASQQVINDTLNNFTGSGTGAAKSSDSNAMKDVSGSLQSGLNAGGSVSGATGVFNSSGDFWKWFSQENSNYINNPYPAPVVSPTRGAGDEIVDFLTSNSNELQDLLRQGGDQR